MADLSALSDGDLLALRAGDITKVSDAGLMALRGPSDTRVALNAASKGIAAIPDMLLNAPQNLVNLGRAAVGTVANAAGRPDLAPDITPPPNFVNRALTAAGAIGPGGEPQNARQRIIDSVMQSGAGMAMNPAATIGGMAANAGIGAASGLVSGYTREATGSDAAGMAAGMLVPPAAIAVGNAARGRIANLDTQRSANAVRDATLADARREGYVTPPSAIVSSPVNNILDSFGGKAAVKQQAALHNQGITNRIAERELGLPEGTAITEGVLDNFRNAAAAPYREVSALSPLAANALQRLRDTRADAKLEWADYNRNAHPQAYRNAQALDQRATMLENAIERIAVRQGSPALVSELRQARQQIAKSYDIERSLNLGDAGVSAPTLGRALDRGAPLTGGLETIGRFAQGPGRQFVAEGSSVPPPSTNHTNIYGGLALGMGGGAVAGPAGVALGALPFLRGPARSLALSPLYQRLMATPNYDPSMATRAASNIPQASPQEAALLALIAGAQR